MIEFYDTSALLAHCDEITSDIWVSEVSVQDLEKMAMDQTIDEVRTVAQVALAKIRTKEPIVVLLEDAITWYEGNAGLESYYEVSRLSNRDFLSVILTAYYIKSICDEEFVFYTESYLSYINAKSLYFDLNTKISYIGEIEND